MFVDASALVAIMVAESDANGLIDKIDRSSNSISSPTVVWETMVAVARILKREPRDAEAAIKEVMNRLRVKVLPIPPEAAALAVDAFARYGKGRHPAALNFGDCFAYACARHYAVPLLYKGDDFDATDIEPA